MIVYYFFAVIACWMGVKSLMGGVRYAAYIKQQTSRELPDFQPFVSVLAPTRGYEQGFIDNIGPLLQQNYPRYEIQFVFDNPQDPCVPLVHDLGAKVVIAGPAVDTGQKVHNLIVA
ncbi:MAG TPA: hypothetical protein VK893_10190, partial [Pyrinomonadaceae bacterium]|nr:hypothetical protein [Pyrinomonadaceae bacterium]